MRVYQVSVNELSFQDKFKLNKSWHECCNKKSVKPKILAILIFFSASFLSGQITYFNYLDYSVKYKQVDNISNLVFTYTNIQNGYISGDTAINGKQYYKQYIITTSSIPSNNSSVIKFIREDANLKFYNYNPANSVESIEYDWSQYLPLTVGALFPSTPTSINNCSVTAIDSILLGTRYLKRWHGPLSSGASTNVATPGPSFIVEGIGLITGGNICFAPLHSAFILSCYSKQNSVLSFSVNGNCAGVNALGINESIKSNNNFMLFPNPAKDNLNITLNFDLEKEFTKIQILNNLGQLIREEEILFKNRNAIIKVNDLPNGIYILNIKYLDSIINKKIVIAK